VNFVLDFKQLNLRIAIFSLESILVLEKKLFYSYSFRYEKQKLKIPQLHSLAVEVALANAPRLLSGWKTKAFVAVMTIPSS
jgi:hypothetical protein